MCHSWGFQTTGGLTDDPLGGQTEEIDMYDALPRMKRLENLRKRRVDGFITGVVFVALLIMGGSV